MKKALLLLPLLFAGFGVLAIDLTKINLSHQYDIQSALHLHHRIDVADGSISVLYEIKADTIRQWAQYFLAQSAYDAEQHDTLAFIPDTLYHTSRRTICLLRIPPDVPPLLLITYVDRVRGNFRLFDIRLQSPLGFPDFRPMDAAGYPIVRNWVPDSLIRMNSAEQFHAYSYIDNFGPADPAMGAMKQIAPKLRIDSSFFFQQELARLEDFHFYLIQRDTTHEQATTLLKCPPYYPKYRRIEELIEPLTYISTASEINSLRENPSRTNFEAYWLKMYTTKFRAKGAIKRFYDLVEEANFFFTSYKQGWETDQGMIYIIFGKPLVVQRGERGEIWKYADGTEFEFIRISTLFTPALYTLKRDPKYEQIWYNQVGAFRKGF